MINRLIITFLASLVFCGLLTGQNKNNLQSEIATINTSDSVIFDLKQAVITSTYIDIPVRILSDDTVDALDFSFKFNESKLTFDSILNYKSYLFALANFNTTDRKLRFTSSSLVRIENNTPLISVRFLLANPCSGVSKTDFNTITTYLKGELCSYKFTDGAASPIVANFAHDALCSTTNITFKDTSTAAGSTITNWSWNFGNGNTSALKNPVTTYSATGTYTVSLIVTASTGCKDTLSKSIVVSPLPSANFTFVTDCTTDTVVFTNNSSIIGGTINNWHWDFGDGDSSTLKDPEHNYNSGGSYTVTLTAISDSGCSSVQTKTVLVSTPTAKFSASSGCYGSITQFTDSSSSTTGTINSWKWYFGDGNTSTIQNPAHLYSSAGTYTVSLKIKTSTNCSDSLVKVITINAKPIVKFGADIVIGCGPLTVNFTDSSTTAPASSYYWDFGDSDTAWSKNSIHTYTTSGTYSVKHIVTSSAGCTDSLIKTSFITVQASPNAKFSASKVCLGSATSFVDSSTISTGTITGWSWNFGDGNQSTSQNPTYQYASAGTYSVTLKVYSNQGCEDSISKTVIIDTKPFVKFGADVVSGCTPLTVSFSDSSTTPTGSTYLWFFGDGDSSGVKNPTHTYSAGGTYSVKHIVTSPGGCEDSLIKVSYITASSSASAKFDYKSGCVGAAISFIDSSTITSGTITSWKWYFGDGSTSITQNPIHSYTTAGNYTVSIKITTSQGCTDSTVKLISIDDKPIVKFGADDLTGCLPQTITFFDSSTTTIGSIYYWSFGGTDTSWSKNTVRSFIDTGYYSVKHIVITPGGCKDSLTKTNYIKINNNPTSYFTPSLNPVTLPDAIVTFSNLSTGTLWLWDFGDSSLSSSKNPTHEFNAEGDYTVCLKAENSSGCHKTYCDTIYVKGLNIIVAPEAFTPNGDNINDLWILKGGPLAELELRVFNEWGNIVFYTETQTEGWDGTFKGLPQPAGAYEYIAKGETTSGKIVELYGVINLIR